MQQAGVCFTLARHGENWWKETLYSTFMHLPTAKEARFQRHFDNADLTADAEEPVKHKQLHRGHWNQVLKSLGETYGTDGSYAADGFEMINKEAQHVCLIVDFEPEGLGGEIHVQVSGKEAKELAKKLASHVRKFLPPEGWTAAEPESADDGKTPAGEAPNRIQLFISYAWNPRTQALAREGLVDAPVPLEYEKPVEVIEEGLKEESAVLEVLRDKSTLKEGDDVMEFINLCRRAHKVLVVHSDKCWRSPFCLYELTQVLRTFQHRPETRNDVVMFLEMPTSQVFGAGKAEDYYTEWVGKSQRKFLPAMMTDEAGTTQDKLMADIHVLFFNLIPEIHKSGRRKRWEELTPDSFVEWVRGFCLKARLPQLPSVT
ncbi:MAG: hypothetical protein H7A46_05385 [Verrucomicrobiales bacterium]|nr:hypothetical protein [Verrucomicrobiales bacterium]